MAAKRLATCKHCGCGFKPDARNEFHQQCCLSAGCRSIDERARKRRYYRGRIASEDGFRESEAKRCREAMRRLRSARKDGTAAATAPAVRPFPPTEQLLVGLVSHLADSVDPHAVAQVIDSYAARGRRLAVADRVRGSP
jgi:hypothetical protein